MTSLLYQQIDLLSKEKGIDPQIVVSAVEDAVLVATRKFYKSSEDLRSYFNKDTGHIEVYAVKKVVEIVTSPIREITLEQARKIDPQVELEGEVKIPKSTDVLGRIAAQTAKQVILQKVREAERESILAAYSQRIGEVISSAVKRIEGGDLIVDLGTTEGRVPKREQSRLENYSPGDRIRLVISKVEKTGKGPQVILSRTDPILLTKLFEMEVPEIYDGTVVIKAAARDTGERSKIAVYSKDKDVDPVGACVGMKGSRVQAIIRELHGEKIDIIPYSEDPLTFVMNALSPAKIGRANVIDQAEKHVEVIVETDQLSLAIGKKGQNVRLASKLTGWKIDIKSDEEKRAEVEDQMAQMAARTPLSELPGLTPSVIEKLSASGITCVEALADTPIGALTDIKGIGPKSAEKIIASVQDYYLQSGQATEPEPTAAEAELAGSDSETASPAPANEVEAAGEREMAVVVEENETREELKNLNTQSESQDEIEKSDSKEE
jgi:transcription termination/antitermination protein NusA